MSPASTGYQAPTVTVSSSLPKRKVDAVLIVARGQRVRRRRQARPSSRIPFLDAEAVGEIEVALKALGAKGGPDQVTRVIAPSLPVASVVAVGLGKNRDEWPADVIRRAAGAAARSLNGTEAVITTLVRHRPGRRDRRADPGRLPVQRLPQREDRTQGHRPAHDHRADRRHESEDQGCGAQRPRDIATAVATARDFVNTPPSHLFPAEFAKRAKALGESAGLEVEVLDDKALAKDGYGGIIGVGKGSSRPPRLVRLIYRGGKSKKSKKVALVGKGITFDTGGISIKPAANMHHMTSDMGGAAAVIATVVLAAKQKLPIDVIATVPMAENMPSSTAQRPGDVLTQYGGITVEVLNTDAEGRLILADAIVRACEDDPDYLIETSTLTGAQTVALGARTPGVMGSDEFRDRVAERQPAGRRERLADAAARGAQGRPQVDGGRPGQRERFALRRHAGRGHVLCASSSPTGSSGRTSTSPRPAYNTGGPWGYTGKGGTGVPTRTMFAVLEDIAANG